MQITLENIKSDQEETLDSLEYKRLMRIKRGMA
jgi:hypothetical protein